MDNIALLVAVLLSGIGLGSNDKYGSAKARCALNMHDIHPSLKNVELGEFPYSHDRGW